jgi:hypothetical protein
VHLRNRVLWALSHARTATVAAGSDDLSGFVWLNYYCAVGTFVLADSTFRRFVSAFALVNN